MIERRAAEPERHFTDNHLERVGATLKRNSASFSLQHPSVKESLRVDVGAESYALLILHRPPGQMMESTYRQAAAQTLDEVDNFVLDFLDRAE